MKPFSTPEIRNFAVEESPDGGRYIIPSPIDRQPLLVIASDGLGWDHISISRKNRVPNWYEMDFVKRLFFEDAEVAFQIHPPVKDHVNIHPNCLHLWRPQTVTIPLPGEDLI